MKKILLILMLPILSGCVTYYTPQVVVENGMYYADEDPAYVNNAYVSGSYIYAGAAYYPWRSMDYFYFGYYPYHYYSPWHYSYSYYSPFYFPYGRYTHNSYGRRHGDYCQPYNACGRSQTGKNGDHKNGGGDHNRYADNGPGHPTDRRNRGGEFEDGNEDPGSRRHDNRSGSYTAPPTRRYVSTAPSGYSGDQGMVIRSGEVRKPGRSRVGPAETEPVLVTGLSPVDLSHTQPDYRSRRDGTEVRYRSGAKQGKSRTDPVRASLPARGTVVSSEPVAVPVKGKSNHKSARGNTRHSSSVKQSSGASSHASSRPASRGSVSRSRGSHSVSSGSSRRSSGRSSSGHSRRHN